MKVTNTQRQGKESGNVLFLILIAVALFAALSYAVTSSTRSGGGTTEREKALLGSASLTQYPTALRTAVVRMVLAGHDIRQIKFDAPGSAAFSGASSYLRVFHPEGGGAVHQTSQGDVMADGVGKDWYHNGNFRVPGIGRDTGGSANDLIAFMPGISSTTCVRINQEMGVKLGENGCTYYGDEVPEFNADNNALLSNIEDADTFPVNSSSLEDIQCGTSSVFTGKATGCFYDSDLAIDGITGHYVFYSVILER